MAVGALASLLSRLLLSRVVRLCHGVFGVERTLARFVVPAAALSSSTRPVTSRMRD